MSGGRRNTPVVSREYKAAPDNCMRALELLLKDSVKEGGPPTAPDDAERRSSDGAKASIRR